MKHHRLRIAVLLHGGLAPYDRGVHVHHLVEIVRDLSKRADVRVFMLQSDGLPSSDFQVDSARVTVLPLDFRVSLWISAFQLAVAVMRSHWQRPFDVIHGLWGLPGGAAAHLASRILALPNVISFLGGETASLPSIQYGGMLRRRSRFLIRYLASHADLLHLISRFQSFQLQHVNLQPKSVLVLPLGTDSRRLLKFNEDHKRKRKVIIHVANITEVKDQQTLVKSFDIIRKAINSELVIVGGDYSQSKLHQLVFRMKLGRFVRFTGHLPHSEVLALMSKADLMLHCSLHEAEGMVLLEAAAMGIPIVTTRVGLGWDWDGYVVDAAGPGDFREVADRAITVLCEPKGYKHFVRKGLVFSEQLSLENTTRRLISAYDAVIRRVQ